ncbi:MAG TPA: hypothetical protein EYG68_01890 [Leucothrix mucor]|nr:hypothetical protein [Leucothrix mucor]
MTKKSVPESSIPESLQSVIETVQKNCNIADARHAGDYTLCVYLLKMREMYRWELGISFNEVIGVDDVGDWLTAREGLWDDLEELAYVPVEVDGVAYDAFDNDKINAVLNPQGYIYNAGLGIRCRPHFFIASLEEHYQRDGVEIFISGHEFARDMAAPPAMMQNGLIFIRNESLRRMLWEKVEEWRMSPVDSPLGRAVAAYDFEGDIEVALHKMAEVESSLIIEHELGEVLAGKLLGEQWNEMLNTLPRSTAEIMLRAIRDHLADALTTLAQVVAKNNPASIHFYFGSLTAMRKKLAPQLMLAYEAWYESNDLQHITDIIEPSRQHWEQLAQQSLDKFAEKGVDAADDIERLVEQNYL